jgi:hypothetical protein
MEDNSTSWSKWPLHFRLTQWLTKQLSYLFFYMTHYLLWCYTEFLATIDHRLYTSINPQFSYKLLCVYKFLSILCNHHSVFKKKKKKKLQCTQWCTQTHTHTQFLLAIYCEIRKLWLQTKLKNSDSLKTTLCKSKQMCTSESRKIFKLHVLNGPCHSMKEVKWAGIENSLKCNVTKLLLWCLDSAFI